MPIIGTKYRAITTDQEFILERIVDRQGGKKLKDPIYHFRYTNRNNEEFTCYLKDVLRSLDFGSWVEIK